MNEMREIYVGKLTLNVGSGRNQDKREKARKLIEELTGQEPITATANKRIAGWDIRPGLPVGALLTLRDDDAVDILERLLYAKDYEIERDSFDDHGNISFGIPEYVDIEDLDYDTDIGMMGLEAAVTLRRPGYRIKHRKVRSKQIPDSHRIHQDDAIEYFEDNFDVTVIDEAQT
jgi:large subunit ribosomal protein L5